MENDLSIYSNGNENPKTLQDCIRAHLIFFLKVEGLDMGRFLLSIASQETSLGADNRPRYERAYDELGFYGNKSEFLRRLLKKYGALAACSYGPWQILYCKAAEHGFQGHPIELWSAHGSISSVLSVINDFIYNGADTLEKLSDAWNSGSFRDSMRPQAYIDQVQKIYDSLPPFDS